MTDMFQVCGFGSQKVFMMSLILQNVVLQIEQLSGNMDAGGKKDGCIIS